MYKHITVILFPSFSFQVFQITTAVGTTLRILYQTGEVLRELML